MLGARTVVAVVLLRAAVARPASAVEEPHGQGSATLEQPADLFRQGLADYDARRFERAIDFFSRAYDQTRAPSLLFNIAQAWRLLGDCVKAVPMYEAFIASDPGSPDVARARLWLERLRPCDEHAGTAAAAMPPNAPAAPAGRPASAALVAAPATRPETTTRWAPPSRGHPAIVGVLGGASAVLLGVGGYAGWRASDLAGHTSALYQSGGSWSREASTIESEGQRAQTEAIVLLSGAVITGVAAYLVHRLAK